MPITSPSATGADILCDTLLANDVDVCFANPGTSEMHFVAALDRKPKMRCVLGLFEGVVTGAADGYSRMADKPAATLLHLGPGMVNGLANLHNARRAASPIVNIVGDHATYHVEYDAPLTSDIEGLAKPMSAWVRTISASSKVASDTAQAIAAARSAPGVATLILPADVAWGDAAGSQVSMAQTPAPAQVSEAAIKSAASALRNGKKTLILLGGRALRASALETASRIAQASGARLIAEQTNNRVERGVGRVAIERIKFSVDAGCADLADIEQTILIGGKVPAAFFAYPGKPSTLLPAGCEIIKLAALNDDLAHALEWLAEELAVPTSVKPLLDTRTQPPSLAEGKLTATAVIVTVGRLLPENAIVCDESVSSGRDMFSLTLGAAPHDFLQITGGAIGQGIPLGTGASIACPDRKVVCVQADGAAMYTLQGLWTQAREKLNVVTIILSNRSYAILHGELKNVGAGAPGHNARRMLDLEDPALDWVSMAKGMGVEAVSVSSVNTFADALATAIKQEGPFLIEALI